MAAIIAQHAEALFSATSTDQHRSAYSACRAPPELGQRASGDGCCDRHGRSLGRHHVLAMDIGRASRRSAACIVTPRSTKAFPAPFVSGLMAALAQLSRTVVMACTMYHLSDSHPNGQLIWALITIASRRATNQARLRRHEASCRLTAPPSTSMICIGSVATTAPAFTLHPEASSTAKS